MDSDKQKVFVLASAPDSLFAVFQFEKAQLSFQTTIPILFAREICLQVKERRKGNHETRRKYQRFPGLGSWLES